MVLAFPFLGFADDGSFHRRFGRYNWRDFQDRDKVCSFIVRAVQVAPSIGTLGFWVSGQVEYLDVPFPRGLALKHFMHRHGFTPDRPAVVQLRDDNL